MSVIRRQPFVAVVIDGREIPYGPEGVMSVRVSHGYDSQIAEADFEVAVVPSWAHIWSQVIIYMGGAPGGYSPTRFVGYFIEPEYTLYPRSVRMTCRGHLVKAQLAENHVVGGTNLANLSGDGYTYVAMSDVAMVGYILDHCGLYAGAQPRNISGCGKLLGQISDGFTWGEGESALAFIQRLEQVTGGYRTYDSPSGTILRAYITTFPSVAPTYTYTEGVDIFHATNIEVVSNIKNRIMVSGYDNRSKIGGFKAELTTPLQQYSPLLPAGVDFITHSFSSSMIERSYNSDSLLAGEFDSSYGVSCESVAAYLMSELNRQIITVTLTTPRDDWVVPGMTIAVNSTSRLHYSGVLWVQHCEQSIDAQGQFTQILKCIGGTGNAAP